MAFVEMTKFSEVPFSWKED